MTEKKPVTRHPKNREQLAHLALAADPAGAGVSAECPDDDAFAQLLEAGPSSPDRQAMVDHISTCDACFQKWLSLTEVLDLVSENKASIRSRKRGLMTAAGSACALAVGVMLYLSIDYAPMVNMEMDSSVPTEPAALTPADGQMKEAEGSGKSPVPRRTMQELSQSESEDKGARSVAKSKSAADEERMDVETAAERNGEITASVMIEKMSVQQSIKGVSPEADSVSSKKKEGAGQFIEQFITLCGDYRDNRLKQTSAEKLIDQGHLLLRSGILPADEQPMIEDIIESLEQRAQIGEHTFSEVCERSVEFGRLKGYEVNNMESQ